jgi:hypothetical protein
MNASYAERVSANAGMSKAELPSWKNANRFSAAVENKTGTAPRPLRDRSLEKSDGVLDEG